MLCVVCRLPPAGVAALVRSYVLVPEDNSNTGATLRASFQLTDVEGRTQVGGGVQLGLTAAARV
jgi:hypothetical protein